MLKFRNEMTKFRSYSVLIVFITTSAVFHTNATLKEKNRRRNPQIENPSSHQGITQHSMWPAGEGLITSASHTQTYQDQGGLAHSNFVITVQPNQKQTRHIADNFSDGLDSARTAEEYVSKAVQMHNQYDNSRKRIPTSSIAKYNLIQHPTPIEVKEPNYRHGVESYRTTSNHNSHYYKNQNNNQNEDETRNKDHSYYHSTTQKPEIKHQTSNDDFYNNQYYHLSKPENNQPAFKDSYTSNTQHIYQPSSSSEQQKFQYHQTQPVKHHIIKIIEEIPSSSTNLQPEKDKKELLSHIEKSVMKVFSEMEKKRKREETRTNGKQNQYSNSINENSSNYLSSTLSPQFQNYIKITKPNKSHQDIMNYVPSTTESHLVDLTTRDQRHRGKVIDLSTLDVGQTWSAGNINSFDHSATLKSAQGFDPTNAIQHQNYNNQRAPKSHKLHFNQQTYHDINALPFTSEKVKSENDNFYTKGYSYDSDHEGRALKSVGASMSVGHHSHSPVEYNVKIISPANEPITVINGISGSNPYKMDVNALRYMLDGLSQAQAYESESSSNISPTYSSHKSKHNDNEEEWKENDPTSTGPHTYPKSHMSISKLIEYDSYNPKYNKNPKGHGYQENYPTDAPRKTRKSKHNNNFDYIKNDGSLFYNTRWHDEFNNDDSWSSDLHGSSTSTKTRVQQTGTPTKSKRNKSNGNGKSVSGASKGSQRSNDPKNTKKTRDPEVELRPPPRYIKF